MFHLITVGDTTLDTFIIIDDTSKQVSLNAAKKLLCFNFADKIPLNHIAQSTGGNAANVAVGAKKLGLRTALVTELGDDINGYTIHQDLEDSGIDTSYINIRKNKETRFSIVLNCQSERTILSYHAPRTYTLPKLPKTEWVYYTSLGKGFEKIQDHIKIYLKKNPKTKLAINPGSYQMNHGQKYIKEIIPLTDILFINKEEAALLIGKNMTIKKSIRQLHTLGAKTVVITDGTNGAHASDGQQIFFMPVYPIIAQAKTGAGDAFTSGFLSATILKKDIETALRWGTANAGGVIQKIGAQKGLLNISGINRICKKYKTIIPSKR
ncbi:carbohydrate kinase family protein [Patescibacteria group bacterium]|nr:carbohydrate kinase family protein [Patescibacteria group bacterium]MBU1721279.1 carbohydrate kinase family protein [Patescibacteria group bacterium]MBU1901013.1 carbohydrate kinase family protein [Patescibacteria group bacterium]